MAYLSKITLPSGTTYDIKDAEAREIIASITGGDAVVFKGVSTTALTNGGTEKPTIDSAQVTPSVGNIFFYGTAEFIWGSDSKWHELGSTSTLGSLAYKNNASGKVTPTGTVSKPTFTGSSSSVTITATENTSGNYQPAGTISGAKFTGASMTSSGKFTPAGSVALINSNKTATVSAATSGEATYTPAGSLSGIAWTGASMTSTGKFTPAGSVTVGTTTSTTTVSPATSGTATYTPGGSVGTPTISVKTAGSTTTIKNPTSTTCAKTVVTAAPGATAPSNVLTYYAVSGETLSLYQLGYTTGAAITTSDVTVKTGDAAYQSSQPSWTGTGVRLVTGNITTPTGSGSFSGTEGNVSVSGTTTGSVSQGTFTGTKVQIGGTTTAAGSVSQPTFTGDEKTVTVS